MTTSQSWTRIAPGDTYTFAWLATPVNVDGQPVPDALFTLLDHLFRGDTLSVMEKCWCCGKDVEVVYGLYSCSSCLTSATTIPPAFQPVLADFFSAAGLDGKDVLVPYINHSEEHVPCP